MLLPALAKAKQKALAVNCVSNLKGNLSTCILYMDDYSSYLPIHTRIPTTDLNAHKTCWTWCDNLMRTGYMEFGSPTIICPAYSNKPDEGGYNGNDPNNAGLAFVRCYAVVNFNCWRSKVIEKLNGNNDNFLAVTRITKPSSAILLADSWGIWNGEKSAPVYTATVNGSDGGSIVNHYYFKTMHNERMNAAFADGHVSSNSGGDMFNCIKNMPLNTTTVFWFYAEDDTLVKF
jgi:prepilin-type processing-associated H-X9-DG protein